MKKILTICILALLLVGCGTNEANISVTDTQIWTSPNKTYTSNDLNKVMKTQDYSATIIASIEKTIAEKEGIDVAKIENDAIASYDEIINSGYGSYIDYYYGSKESYIDNTVSGSVVDELRTKLINNKYEDLKNEYLPYLAEVVYFNTEDEANKTIADYKEGLGTFEFIASQNGYAETIEEKVYTDQSDLPIEVKEAIQNINGNGLTDVIQTSVTANSADGNSVVTPRYYVVNIISKNSDEFKDKFVSYLASEVITADDVINDYLKTYKVKIHDQTTYNLLKDKYQGLEY